MVTEASLNAAYNRSRKLDRKSTKRRIDNGDSKLDHDANLTRLKKILVTSAAVHHSR